MVFVLTVSNSKCSTKKYHIVTVLVNDFKKLVKPRTILYFFNKQVKKGKYLAFSGLGCRIKESLFLFLVTVLQCRH